ncbi:unnamed protein product [Callosobruchus maculatus]|uniref:Uncharacterized protein n=1 Tax=Callosobruchus maculatus TaxID=64391 RepID=A0A653CAE5_CALMS|nr:unnamed protein product [Callosobruchus maculatus]
MLTINYYFSVSLVVNTEHL